MRRMFSKKQLTSMIDQEILAKTVESLVGKDINVEGITSKGIANTGGLANIGNVAVSGDITATGTIKGALIKIPFELNELFAEGSYGECVIEGNMMFVVIAGSIPQQETNLGTIKLGEATIPEGLRSKLHVIPSGSGSTSDNVLTQAVVSYLYSGSYSNTGARVRFNSTSGILDIYATIGAGQNNNVNYISARIPVILD